MSFDSLSYLVFLPVVVFLHWRLPSRFRWMLLLGASYIFYASWDVALSLLIFSVTALSYLAGRLLERALKPSLRRLILAAALALPAGVLIYFKYFNLLGTAFFALFGGTWRLRDIILPVGISFYTFQAMAYVIDVFRKSIPAEKHFGFYALYIAFFPQLVAGPIERAGALLPQLRAERSFSSDDLSCGLRLMITGFFRKIVIADLIAPFVDTVYRAEFPDGSAVLMATLLFAIQIYGDFSGYSEIASGSARLLGIRLMANFNRPYGAKDIRAFWHRWHISLTGWFTDYVYIPLGGSRKGLFRQMLATTVVFALCGLWHGANTGFILWGLLHAGFMLLYTLLRRAFPDWQSGYVSQGLTLSAVCLSWIFFRAGKASRALFLCRQLFSRWHLKEGIRLLKSASLRGTSSSALIVLLFGMLFVLDRLPASDDRAAQANMSGIALSGLFLAILIAVFIRLDAGTANAFIYFQF